MNGSAVGRPKQHDEKPDPFGAAGFEAITSTEEVRTHKLQKSRVIRKIAWSVSSVRTRLFESSNARTQVFVNHDAVAAEDELAFETRTSQATSQTRSSRNQVIVQQETLLAFASQRSFGLGT